MCSSISINVTGARRDDKSSRLLVWAAMVLAVFGFTGCATGVKNTTRSFTTVVIDAGHGGHDDGARSRWGGREKHHALSVAQKLDTRLRDAGFKTVMTRTSDNFVELNHRARISNRQSNALFVSVHFNSSPRRSIRGAEVYYKAPFVKPLAQRILAEIDSIPGCTSRYVKTANFRVLRLNRYPAVLVECGYLSNRSEGASCASKKKHEQFAAAIARAIVAQRGGPPRGAKVAAATTTTGSPGSAAAPVGTTQR